MSEGTDTSKSEPGTLVRALVGDRAARLVVVDLRAPAEHTRRIHGLGPDAARLAAEVSVAAVLASAYIKGEEQLTWQLQGEKPRCSVYADVTAADAQGESWIRVRASPPDLRFSADGGRFHGLLMAIKHSPRGEIYRGMSVIQGETLESGMAKHLGTSDQLDVLLRLGATAQGDGALRSVGGLLLERLPVEPTLPSMTSEEFNRRYAWVRQADLSQLMTQIAFGSLGDEPIELLERTAVYWKCRCSESRIEATLNALDLPTLNAMIEEDHGAKVTCNFCGREYTVTEERLRELRAARKDVRKE